MNTDDIIEFAKKNGIELEENEVDLIYHHIKTNWKTIVYGNPRGILDDIKSKVNDTTYEKIENLYVKFHDRYRSYL